MTTRVNEKTSEAKKKVKVKAIDQEEHDACNRAGWKESGERERERERERMSHLHTNYALSLWCVRLMCARS